MRIKKHEQKINLYYFKSRGIQIEGNYDEKEKNV